MIDHIVTPRSMKDIRTIVNVIKKRCGFYDYLLFPVMFFWEQIIPKIFQDYRFLYVEDDELKGFEAYTDHNLRLVKVKVSVYEKALNGSPKDLFTIAHEYYNLLARLNLDNFGKIYYYIDTMEPLEVEDVFELDLFE